MLQRDKGTWWLYTEDDGIWRVRLDMADWASLAEAVKEANLLIAETVSGRKPVLNALNMS
jgi:hypothetical protein